jgi:alkanesulfonate monooxygenase SsuD/methylene tetrahydromethanopterin reductase-like flavin-dependent oxidoreductase (luciferase family)
LSSNSLSSIIEEKKEEEKPQNHLFGVSIAPYRNSIDKSFEIARFVDDAEAIDIIGIQDHPYTAIFVDTWILLTALATSTRRVKFFTNVADVPLRLPSVLAKTAASLDLLTKGRVELGVGAGVFWRGIAGFGGPSRTASEAVSALEDAIQIIRTMWNAEDGSDGKGRKRVSYYGKFYRLQRALPGPAPYHKMEIWIGGQRPKMLNLIGRLGDGWSVPLQTYFPAEMIKPAQQKIDDAAKSVGRSPGAIRRIRGLAGIIDEEGRLDKSPRGQGELVVGSPQDWVDELIYNINELGMDSFVFWPSSEGEEMEQIRLFTEKVVPKVKERTL